MATTTRLPAPEILTELNSQDDPAVLIGLDYRLLAVNSAYDRVFGALDLRIPKHCYEVSHEYQAPCYEVGQDCPLKDSLASGQKQRRVHLHVTPNGEQHVEEETIPLKDQKGQILYFLQLLRPTHVASSVFVSDGMVGRSCAFNRMVELIHRVASRDTTVLLLGETGTGKELAAKAIHRASPRHAEPFVPVDCSGLTESLFESELFGHEKGAFTGASSAKRGLVEAARGGTLFLDEIGDIPLPLQVKLLRLLETDAYRRVGSVETRAADFRLICATHQDLPALCREGAFRKDLYYRIKIFSIKVPPLTERRIDIPLLAEVMLRRLGGESPPRLDPRTVACLSGYDYPGNVRELKHIIERALLLTDGDTILHTALGDECCCDGDESVSPQDIVSLKEAEKRYLRSVQARYKGDNKTLAKFLGISERTLYRKLEALSRAPDEISR